MFEDPMVESSGRIRTRSTYYSGVGVLLNGSLLAALFLVPLLHPDALPRTLTNTMLLAPPAPAPAALPVHLGSAVPVVSELSAPAVVGRYSRIASAESAAPPMGDGVAEGIGGTSDKGALQTIFGSASAMGSATVVTLAPARKMVVSQGVMAGNVLFRPEPSYPAIARAARVQGTVILSATISKVGVIENLVVVSGSPMLAAAALQAVRQWRYKPYLLNGEPVEVQTQVSVVFRAEPQ